METRSIGSLDVSAVGLGCNNFGWHIDEDRSHRVVRAALDAGINHFDTAELYGDGASESFLGRALKGERDRVMLATKFGHGTDARPETVRRSLDASLARLGTDRIDLYYLHRPDAGTPIADTLGALQQAVDAGKVREIGCSGFSPEQMHAADRAAGTGVRFVALQNEYSLLHRKPEGDGGTLQVARETGMAFVPYFPLKSGLLTGKYRKGDAPPEGSRLAGKDGSHFDSMGDKLLTEENLDAVERLIGWTEGRGRTILDLAFAYLLAHGGVASVIAGATKPEQVRGNVAAAEWALSEAEVAEVRALLGG